VRRQLEVNLVAPTVIARLVLPVMRARGDGRIVNISSLSARVSSPFLGWYVASKMALEGVTDALRMEVAPFGIKVVLVEPGPFRTEIWDKWLASLPAGVSSPYARWYDARDDVRELFEALAPTIASDYAKSVGMRLRTPPARLSRLVQAVTGRRSTSR